MVKCINLMNKVVLVIGWSLSVDKNYRLQMEYNWYSSKQPSEEIKIKF